MTTSSVTLPLPETSPRLTGINSQSKYCSRDKEERHLAHNGYSGTCSPSMRRGDPGRPPRVPPHNTAARDHPAIAPRSHRFLVMENTG
ncbi:hypothetical protein EYF80_027408 [Liparis tanakae]|uniref:Uncharacterized protein n=1 Tax=Liparis tanakae TaxID=230148 RepID=A0A4Z2H932_9TELE|nr:hypothetical protein EYF80_027408 [Liparis tanakae]